MGALDVRAIDAGGLPAADFPKVRHEFRIFVAEAAFDRATGRGDARTDREIGGILVGEVCRDDAGPYVRIDATIDALHAEEAGTELTFTHATWEHIHKEMDTSFKGKRIVGWYHTHPGFGIFLSDRDAFIHQSFFNLPYQIAMVYDPKSREHGIFAWRENEPRRVRRYWIGEREQVWDGAPPPRRTSPTAEMTMPEAAPRREHASDDPPDRFGLMLTGLVVLIVGGLGGWFMGRWSAADELQRARQEGLQQSAAAIEATYQTLNSDLVGALQESVARDGVTAAVRDGTEAIDRALTALRPASGTAPPEVAELEAAKRKLEALRASHDVAAQRLDAIARMARRGDPTQQRHALVLGQLCALLASSTQDKATAQRLLGLAILVDPGSRELYEKKIKELEK